MSKDAESYEAPQVEDLGTLAELTQQKVNKLGSANDAFTALTGGAVVGSVVPAP